MMGICSKQRIWTAWITCVLVLLPWICGPVGHADPPNKYNQMEKLNHRGIWDDNLTRAKSGLFWEIPDEGSSEGKSGVKEDPRNFYIPTHEQLNLMYDQVERDDISNVGKIRDYSNEALLQLPVKMVFNGQDVPGGYYQAYLGDWYSGSKEINMGHYEEFIPPDLQKQRRKGKLKEYSAVILKRQGRVVAAFPIDRRERYDRKKGQRKAKRPFALIAQGPQGPEMRIYYRKWIYIVGVGPQVRPVEYPPVTQGIEQPDQQQLAPLSP